MARNNFYSQFDSDESELPDIFGEDDTEYSPAFEALDDDVDDLEDMDESGGEDAPQEDDAENQDDNGGEDDNLAAATDQQLKDDKQSTDDENLDEVDNGENDEGAGDENPDPDPNTTGSDPLRSIETKSAYKKKFTMLYGIIIDSLTTMETFSPAYNNKFAKDYYEIESGLSKLKSVIYDICTEKLNSMTVDEVLRQYTLCNLTYDTITRKLKEFSDRYNAEQRKLDVNQRVKDTASKLARGNKLLGQKRPTTK